MFPLSNFMKNKSFNLFRDAYRRGGPHLRVCNHLGLLGSSPLHVGQLGGIREDAYRGIFLFLHKIRTCKDDTRN